MIRATVRIALVTAGLAGCATLRADRGPSPEERLAEAITALGRQDFARARPLLEGVYRETWQEPVGQRAMLLLAAAELDSRNPDRRVAAAAELSGRYLAIEETPRWTVPLAESLYLLAVELGAFEQELARAEEEKREAQEEARSRTLPKSTRESVPARIRKLTTDVDELQRRLGQAQQQLAAREKELAAAQQELERIRKTLKK